MVEPRIGRGGRLSALPVHSRRHARAAAARQTERRDMSLRRWSVTLLTALVALVTIAPLLWMVSVSFMVRGSGAGRSEEHTSELQSLMRISYAVFCLKKKNQKNNRTN